MVFSTGDSNRLFVTYTLSLSHKCLNCLFFVSSFRKVCSVSDIVYLNNLLKPLCLSLCPLWGPHARGGACGRPCGPAGCVCALLIVVAKRCASVDASTASLPYPEIPAAWWAVYQVTWGLSSWCVCWVLDWVFFPCEWHSPGASFSLSALTCRISKR